MYIVHMYSLFDYQRRQYPTMCACGALTQLRAPLTVAKPPLILEKAVVITPILPLPALVSDQVLLAWGFIFISLMITSLSSHPSPPFSFLSFTYPPFSPLPVSALAALIIIIIVVVLVIACCCGICCCLIALCVRA